MTSSYDVPVGRFARDWNASWSHVYVWSAYVVAGAVAALAAYVVDLQLGVDSNLDDAPLLLAGIADFVATVVIWCAAIVTNNSSLYDPYWSVYTPVVTIFWALRAAAQDIDVPLARVVLVNCSAWAWGVRLTSNWAFAWKDGLKHQDWRYSDIEGVFRKHGYPKTVYWVVGSFGGIMLFPTVMVFASTIPAYNALVTGVNAHGAKPFNWLDVVATIICLGAAAIQWVSDRQMRLWRENNTVQGACMESGLWRYSRHPNYFGEVMFWWGIFLHALASKWEFYYTIPGAVIITLLFCFISIPLMETRSLERRPDYRRIMQSTSMLVPFFRFPVRENGIDEGGIASTADADKQICDD